MTDEERARILRSITGPRSVGNPIETAAERAGREDRERAEAAGGSYGDRGADGSRGVGEAELPPATDKQIKFIRSLLDERAIPEREERENRERLETGMTKADASALISQLLEQPKARSTRRAPVEFRDDVPAGRYAITGDDGSTVFYKVDRPTEGDWAGYVFVRMLVAQGGHGLAALGQVKLGVPQQRSVLDRIAEAGVAESSARFGHDLGHCGVCGRELTKDESIARGIGPVCAEKMGW